MSSRSRGSGGLPTAEAAGIGTFDALLGTIETELRVVLWMIDLSSQRIVYASPVYETIWGRSRARLYEDLRDWMEALAPGDQVRVAAAYEGLLQGEPLDIEYRILLPDGTQRWIHARGGPVTAGTARPTHVVGIARDTSRERQIREDLRAATLSAERAEERERRSLAGDLHDSVGQLLPLALMKLETLREEAGSRLEATVEELRSLLAQAERETRTLTFQLTPVALGEDGFAAAVGSLAGIVHEQYALAVVVDDDGTEEPPGDDRAAVLLRGVRELLINTSRHARTDKAEVRIAREGGTVAVTVEDAGVGFDPATLQRGAGFGLFALRDRMERLGGWMEIDSAPGRGTRTRLVMPLSPAETPD